MKRRRSRQAAPPPKHVAHPWSEETLAKAAGVLRKPPGDDRPARLALLMEKAEELGKEFEDLNVTINVVTRR